MFWKQIVQYIWVITTKSFDILLLSRLLTARPNTPDIESEDCVELNI